MSSEQTPGRTLRRKMIALMLVMILVAAVGMYALSQVGRTGSVDPLRQDLNMDLLSIPDFSLTSQDGETVDRSVLDGRVTMLDFFFTHCPFVCVPMGRNMRMAQQALEGTDVRFLSISVDPERDTPERLRAYAEGLGANLSTWTFLTGDRAQANRILREGLMLAELVEDPNRPITLAGGETMANIAHPSLFILVGPERQVLALANGTDAQQVRVLIERAREAAGAVE